MHTLFAVVHSHSESVLALRIFFSVCLVIVICAGLYMLKHRQGFLDAIRTSSEITTARATCGCGR
jgi:hypothetical protein